MTAAAATHQALASHPLTHLCNALRSGTPHHPAHPRRPPHLKQQQLVTICQPSHLQEPWLDVVGLVARLHKQTANVPAGGEGQRGEGRGGEWRGGTGKVKEKRYEGMGGVIVQGDITSEDQHLRTERSNVMFLFMTRLSCAWMGSMTFSASPPLISSHLISCHLSSSHPIPFISYHLISSHSYHIISSHRIASHLSSSSSGL